MKTLLRTPLLTVLMTAIASVLAPASAQAGGCTGADAAPGATGTGPAAVATLCLLNEERAGRGLTRLQRDGHLGAAAERHARDMIARSYFSHRAPDGSRSLDRIRAAGYIPSAGPWIVGENLAWGIGRHATPREVVAGWMASPTHRANILEGRYREIGLGVLLGNPRRADGAGATYVTTFGAAAASARTTRRARTGATRRRAARSRTGPTRGKRRTNRTRARR